MIANGIQGGLRERGPKALLPRSRQAYPVDVKRNKSDRDVARPNVTDRNDSGVTVGASTYVLASVLETELMVSRQTMWRWRAEEKIPAGHVYRKQLVFTEDEADLVRKYANRVEPAKPSTPRQLGLFKPRGERK